MEEVTILDVAEKAGVSPSTVSRVINESAPVASETRKKVNAATEALGYTPNKFAHALRKQTSNVFGIIVPDISNPFFSTLIRGAEGKFHEENRSVIICDTKGETDQEQINVEMLIKERVDGVIVTSAEREIKGLSRLLESGIPLIAVDRKTKIDGIPTVMADNEGAGRSATEHLLDRGCDEIGFIRGPAGVSTASERFKGYRMALRNRDLNVDRAFVMHGDFTFESGREALRRLVETNDRGSLPSGIVVANDLMAVGVIRGAEELEIEVPTSLAVVGFDDILLSRLINPSLTTVSAPTYEMGKTAAELTLDRAEGGEEAGEGEMEDRVFETELVERESSQYGDEL